MNAKDIADWMVYQLRREGCIYQDDVVDYAIRGKAENLLRENTDGNQVIGTSILKEFRNQTETTVVWVKPDKYWRWRVAEDEPSRDARG